MARTECRFGLCGRHKKMEWIGYIMKIDQVKKMFDSKPKGRRRNGRQRIRWVEDV
jgi:hypothetical protein